MHKDFKHIFETEIEYNVYIEYYYVFIYLFYQKGYRKK